MQNEIYQLLKETDLKALLDNLNHSKESLRKLSGLFLCEILYSNKQLQMLFCDKYNILYSRGKVTLN